MKNLGQKSTVPLYSGGQFSPSVRPNPATGFRPPSATGTLWCLQKEMATYRHWSVSLWQDPDDVPHCRILSPDKTEWWLISATLCGWRRCFVADQFWFMTRIREEEEVPILSTGTCTYTPQVQVLAVVLVTKYLLPSWHINGTNFHGWQVIEILWVQRHI